MCGNEVSAFYSLFFVSIEMVTGPSFNSSTFMSAPNSPVPIGFPIASLGRHKSDYRAVLRFHEGLRESSLDGSLSYNLP